MVMMMMIKRSKPSKLNVLALWIFCFFLSSLILVAMPQEGNTVSVDVGYVGDFSSREGKLCFSSIKMALMDFYDRHSDYKTRLVLRTRQYRKDHIVGAAAAALDLVKHQQIRAIIGPMATKETSFIISLGERAQVPIISFSATNPTLPSIRSPYFFQFAQTDSAQVEAASHVVKAFGWSQVVPICIDTLHGRAFLPVLTDALQEVGARIPNWSLISPSATDDQIVEELCKLKKMQTRVFIVHMTTDLCSRVFSKINEIGMMSEGYVWITTNWITNSIKFMDPSVINSMEGVIGLETYVQETTRLDEFKLRWQRQLQKDNATIYFGAELDVLGLWAYDTVFALAMAVEHVIGTTDSFDSHKAEVVSYNSTDLESLSVSPYGPRLCEALSTTRFQGMAGDFILIDGQLQSPKFRIININSGTARTIGFWTPRRRLVRKMNSAKSTSHLGAVIWPGDSLSVPKGWEFPTNGRKLRIGVPVKAGFTELVKVTKNPNTNKSDVTGFSIDVFKAVVDMVPYPLPYEFIPFENSDGTKAGTYDDLCYEVYLGNFDAVVGDTTIRANRSLYVDFTMPYTESDVVMVVPSKNAWVFRKSLTWGLGLGLTSAFIGFVVWVLEHRVGTSFWFACSTIVFAHRKRDVSNLRRSLIVIWLILVLILVRIYTASLSSLLTVEQLQPAFTDIEYLLKNHEHVGYIKNSFIYDLLKQVGFDDTDLKEFETMEEIDEALSKGTAKGGVAAVVHGTPDVKLFLAKYCSKYTMIGPIFKTDGFAFVFPKRSPLLSDFSQAIINVTVGEKIMSIENKWFKKDSDCEDFTKPELASNRHDVIIFYVLFLFSWLASALVMGINVGRTYKYGDGWNSAPTTSGTIKDELGNFSEIDSISNQQPDVVTASKKQQ